MALQFTLRDLEVMEEAIERYVVAYSEEIAFLRQEIPLARNGVKGKLTRELRTVKNKHSHVSLLLEKIQIRKATAERTILQHKKRMVERTTKANVAQTFRTPTKEQA